MCGCDSPLHHDKIFHRQIPSIKDHNQARQRVSIRAGCQAAGLNGLEYHVIWTVKTYYWGSISSSIGWLPYKWLGAVFYPLAPGGLPLDGRQEEVFVQRVHHDQFYLDGLGRTQHTRIAGHVHPQGRVVLSLVIQHCAAGANE